LADWYFGYTFKDPGNQGVFPASHTAIITYEKLR
jgi:hypothetical protein